MLWTELSQMCVESPCDRIVVIRVAGVLDGATAMRATRLIAMQPFVDRRCATRHLVVDLSGVRRFEHGGLETLYQDVAHRSDVAVHVAGCAGHLSLLPKHVCDVITRFSTFPTLEAAVARLSA